MHHTLNDVNKLKRQLFFNVAIADKTEIVLQVKPYGRIFGRGYRHLILGRITTFLVTRATRRPGHGSSKVTPSRNGSGPDLQVLFYGSMESVSCLQLLRSLTLL